MDIASAIERLTKDGAASVLFFEVDPSIDPECKVVGVTTNEPPLPVYFWAETFEAAIAKAVEAHGKVAPNTAARLKRAERQSQRNLERERQLGRRGG